MKCEIELRQRRNRIFLTGDTINANIVLRLNQNTVINEVSVQVLGYAKCSWSIDTSYHGRVEHLNANIILVHKPLHGQPFAKGIHRLPFVFDLASTLPASFSSHEGCVKYKLRVSVKRLGVSNALFEWPFLVAHAVDLNTIAGIERPLLRVTAKEFLIDFTSKSLYMTAMIPQQGFVPHQVIDVRTQVDNRSIVYVKYVKISLKKIVTFTYTSPQENSRRIEMTKAVVYCGDVPAHSKRTFVKYLKVPQLTANITNCDIIRVSYEVQVKAKSIGVTRSPVLRLPIQIGTVPLVRDTSDDYEIDMTRPMRLEIAPMSYEECMAITPETRNDGDLIDFNLPSYDEAVRQSSSVPQRA